MKRRGATTETTVAVTGISVDIVSATLEVGATKQVNASVIPTNASNKNIVWNSSNTSIATISASGLITAKASGSCTITARTSDGGFTKTINVTVTQAPIQTIPVTGIEVDEWDVSLKVGNSKQLNAHVIPRNTTNQLIHWYSNNTSVATVTSNGLVRAIGEGYALITATTDDGGIPYNVHINVGANSSGGATPNPPTESPGGNNTPPSGSNPSLSPSSATLNRNQSQTFTIVGTTSTIARREFANSRCSIDGETDNTITITGRVSGSDVLIVTLSDGTQLQAQITIN